MKLTNAQCFELYLVAFRAVAGRERWPTTAPPNKHGEVKDVRPAFGVAVWANALARDAAWVLEAAEREPADSPTTDPGKEPERVPF